MCSMLRVPNDLEARPAHTEYGERPLRHAPYWGEVARPAAQGVDLVHPDKSWTPILARRIQVGMTTLLVYSRYARRSFSVMGRPLT